MITVLVGSVTAFVLPAFAGYDEPLHFLRAWQVSDGRVTAVTDAGPELGGRIPADLRDDIGGLLRDAVLDPGHASDAFDRVDDPAPRGDAVFVEFPNAAVYSPVPYLPSALALRIGRLLGASTLVLSWLGRLANVIAYAFLVALAVRRIPARQWLLGSVALVPVALLQHATFSADGLTYGLTLLVVAEAIRLAASPRTALRAPYLAEVAAATIALALAKQPYALVAALLAVPMWVHRGRIAGALAGATALAAALGLAWSRWAQSHYTPPVFAAAELDSTTYAYRGVDPDRQLTFVREHPLDLLAAIGRTIGHYAGDLLPDVLTQTPGWRPPTLLAIAVLAAAAVVWSHDRGPLPYARTFAALTAAVVVAGVLAVFLLAYAGWNEVGAPRIDAFQGRYLLPFVTVALVVCSPQRGRPARTTSWPTHRLLAGALVVEGLLALVVVAGLARHYYA